MKHLREHPCKYIEVAPKEECKGLTHLETFLQDIVDKAGEGIILRDPYAPLQPGRSSAYLKHKVRQNSGGLWCLRVVWQWS